MTAVTSTTWDETVVAFSTGYRSSGGTRHVYRSVLRRLGRLYPALDAQLTPSLLVGAAAAAHQTGSGHVMTAALRACAKWLRDTQYTHDLSDAAIEEALHMSAPSRPRPHRKHAKTLQLLAVDVGRADWDGPVAAFGATLTERTREDYVPILLAAYRLADPPLVSVADIDTLQLLAWRRAQLEEKRERGLTAGTFRDRLTPMRSFVAWTFGQGMHDLSPERVSLVLKLPPAAIANPREPLTEEELTRLIGATRTTEERALVAVMTEAGLRAGAVSGLDVRDLGRDRTGVDYLTVRTDKGGRQHVVVLLPDTAHLLGQHCAGQPPEAPMFQNRRRGRLGADGVWRRVKSLGSCADLPGLHPHQLRHTCAMRTLKVSGNVMLVAKLLGHRDIRTTQGYLDHLNLRELMATLAPLPVDLEEIPHP